MLQSLDEVIHGVSDGLAGNVLQHWQEHLKSHPGVLLILLQRENIITYAENSVSNELSMNILASNDRRQ